MSKSREQQILNSWKKNAAPWTAAVRNAEIASRTLVSNQAIVDTVLSRQPRRVLDLGCGEGWLVRELTHRGMDTLGVDAIPELVAAARAAGIGQFRQLSHEDLATQGFAEPFDLVVCNFSLFGDASVTSVFESVRQLLRAGGSFIVQTLNPAVVKDEQADQDGWRPGSWDGFREAFSDPAPWYFRTLASWRTLFVENGFLPPQVIEPAHPQSGEPVSLILAGELGGSKADCHLVPD